MSELWVVKTIIGEFVATQIQSHPDGYMFIKPFVLDLTETNANAKRFVLGSNDMVFTVPKSYVVTMGKADDFIRQLYGSTLFNVLIQELLMDEDVDFDSEKEYVEFINSRLSLQKQEIFQTYGLLDMDDIEDEENNNNKKVLH